MLSVEFLRECGNLIEKFGFPIFFCLFALLMFYLMFRYFTKTITKKDCDFLEYQEKRDGQFLDLSNRHIESTNTLANAVNHNTSAINDLKNTTRARSGRSKVTAEAIKQLADKLPETGAIPKPENNFQN